MSAPRKKPDLNVRDVRLILASCNNALAVLKNRQLSPASVEIAASSHIVDIARVANRIQNRRPR